MTNQRSREQLINVRISGPWPRKRKLIVDEVNVISGKAQLSDIIDIVITQDLARPPRGSCTGRRPGAS